MGSLYRTCPGRVFVTRFQVHSMPRPARISLQAVLGHDAVTAPRQDRSQRTLERILDALAGLLREKSFDAISMAELAARASCVVTSIYARFEDKGSLVAALHESFRRDALARIDALLAPERWRDAKADEIIAASLTSLVGSYRQHRHLLHAVLLTDDPRVYARVASTARHASKRLARVLPAPAGVPAAEFARRVEFGMRVVIATLQQRVLFQEVPAGPLVRSDAALTRELGRLLTSYLHAPGAAPRRETRRARRR